MGFSLGSPPTGVDETGLADPAYSCGDGLKLPIKLM